MGSRTNRWAIAAIAAIASGTARPASADEIIRPCRPGTPAHTAAGAALAAIDVEIRQLAPAEDPEPLKTRLEDLGKQACFRFLDGLDVHAKSGLALRTWWEDGGHGAAASALKLGGKDPYVWVKPDVRRALTIETAPHHRLAPLLCPAYDDKCGRETDGWRLRAEAALKRDVPRRNWTLAGWTRERPPKDDDCPRYAQQAPRRRQFAQFRYCLDVTAERSPRFAIGRVRRPTEGWLVVSGRRGHYHFCDELRAFDLATGAAYRVGSCSDLALMSDGRVDHRGTDAARKTERERGTVSLDEIREAAWMLIQLGEIDESVRKTAIGHALPKSIPLASDGNVSKGFGLGRLVSISSAQTRLDWRVTTMAGELGSGTITWGRDPDEDEEAYATELLEVAEASFTPGCPPAAPPVALRDPLRGLSANKLDTDAKSLRQAAASLDDGWRDLIGAGCPAVTAPARR